MNASSSEIVAVVGDGQMGLVLADLLVARGAAVRLWGNFPDEIETLRATRRSPRLADFVLPAAVEVTADAAEALGGATLAVNAVPTQYVRRVWTAIGAHLAAAAPVVSVSKGIEIDTLDFPCDVLRQVLPATHGGCCVLSGPTIAAELARHLPATVVAASSDEGVARRVQDLCNGQWLRVYRLDDVMGVEIAGATKNVIALAAGMVDGMEAGLNAKSALLARGLAEIARLGVALGARLDTFFGVAGVGDLATTCFSPHSRNRTCGERLGRGQRLDEVLESSSSVVEGVPTTRALHALARRRGVEMPITEAVFRILFEGLRPRDAIVGLMARETKAERVG
jgi:glycerol-3-phosphate dehydrogenase (NAD(P)+)